MEIGCFVRSENSKKLEKEEIEYLFARFHAGDMSAKDRIIEGTSYLARVIVKRKFRNRYRNIHEYKDLCQVAVIGLIDAVNKYKETSKCKFETYANIRITGTIIDYLRVNHSIPIPAPTMKKAINVLNKLKKLNREYTAEDFDMTCKSFGYDPPFIETLVLILGDYLSIDDYSEKTSELFGSMFCPELNDSYIDLKENLQCLDETELEVIRQYYYEDATMHQIAFKLGLTEPRISQVHTKAIGKLREKFKAK